MIVLDTNVLSETLRPRPDARVMAWLESQPASAPFTTAVTRGEILYGVRLLPEGRRRENLQSAVTAILNEDFSGRMLFFDDHAADAWARIAATRRLDDQPISQSDAMIAAMTHSRGATLATRNTRDFTGCDIKLINPWVPPAS